MNWATLSHHQHTGQLILYYQGWLYRQTYERYVLLPFDELSPTFSENATLLLHAIFDPFTRDSTGNTIKVVPHPSEKECFMVHLLLFFKTEPTGEDVKMQIDKALNEVDDLHEDGAITYYWLD
jgi:hypothetical protein